MKNLTKSIAVVVSVAILLVVWRAELMAATNTATNAAGGGVTLTNSGSVTVNAATLGLVKVALDNSGACLTTTISDAGYGGTCTNTAAITVPSGTTMKFLILVRNTTDVQINDVRFQDLIDDTAGAAGGFTYTAASMKTTSNPADIATVATIYTDANAGTNPSDAVDTGGTNYASINTGVSPDSLTVGAHATQTNEVVNVPAHKTFAIIFTATKN